MPSQDKYLDELLGNLADNLDEGKDSPLTNVDMSDMDMLLQSAAAAHEEFGVSGADSLIAELEQADEASESLGLDDMANMSEDDIIKLLEAGQQEPETEAVDDVDDLMSLLNASDDSDLQEIQNLLQKADNNEPVEDTANGYEQETPVMSDKQKQQEEKRLQREAQKEAKKAAQEAKNAAKAAKKAQKEASKAEKKAFKASKAKKAVKEENSPEENARQEDAAVSEQQRQLEEEIAAMDFLKDINIDDSIMKSAAASADSLEKIEEKKDKKVKKDKKDKTGNADKKKGAFSRFIDFLNEEESEEEEAIQLSDENKKILKEMNKEKKNKKKSKSKKGQTAERGEDGENGNIEAQKGKKTKREKKPKKEKVPKPEAETIPEKKLSKKKLAAIALVCISLGLVILICSNFVGDYSAKNTGKEAYYEGDYQTCFQSLYGKELNESEQVMYSKSESILTIRLWLSEYELLAKEGWELEALDSLIQAVYDYPTLYGYSVQWNAGTEVAEVYEQILQILLEKYHLSEAQVMEIANIPDDVEYTRAVMAVVAGDFDIFVNENPYDKGEVPDKLPEESELGDAAFVDNNG